MKSKRYPNLHKLSWSPNWVFRKYASAKRAEFAISTGFEATEANASAAYRHGLEKFNHWLGVHMAHGRQPLIRDLSRAILAGKKGRRKATEIKARTEIRNHIDPSFGHLRPDQVTSTRLVAYEQHERAKGRTSLYNTRKILFEILRRARDEGLIRALPAWKPLDPDPEAPRFIDRLTFRAIRRISRGAERLVQFIMYHQGARPGEVCKYRWEMIRWERRPVIDIPGTITKTRRKRSIPLNTRVARALRPIRKEAGPIFPGQRGNACRVVFDREWRKAMGRLGLDYSIYNLRDTFITTRLRRASAIFIGKYTDTSARMIEKKYAVPTDEIMESVAG